MTYLTEAQARILATHDKSYAAIKRNGQWFVWCNDSEHAVEFDQRSIDRAKELAWANYVMSQKHTPLA